MAFWEFRHPFSKGFVQTWVPSICRLLPHNILAAIRKGDLLRISSVLLWIFLCLCDGDKCLTLFSMCKVLAPFWSELSFKFSMFRGAWKHTKIQFLCPDGRSRIFTLIGWFQWEISLYHHPVLIFSFASILVGALLSFHFCDYLSMMLATPISGNEMAQDGLVKLDSIFTWLALVVIDGLSNFIASSILPDDLFNKEYGFFGSAIAW